MGRTKIRTPTQTGRPQGVQQLGPEGWAQVVKAIRELTPPKPV